MPRFEMPMGDTREPTEFAGRPFEALDPTVQFSPREIAMVDERQVIVANYDEEKGLYLVKYVDDENTRSPMFRVSPASLKKC